MNHWGMGLRSVVPYRFRRYLRARHRDFVFRRALRRFRKDPAACADPDSPVIRDFVYGWGNPEWSALGEYLAGCIRHALTVRGPILECGSGLSTILVGAVAKMRGDTHWALEHTPEWAEKVRHYLKRYKIDSVVLSTSPLKDYGDYCWYEPPVEVMPKSFSMVVCDGPPGNTKGGRYGLVPIMSQRLKQGCVILLDDAGREGEMAIAQRWVTDLGASFKLVGSAKPYIEMMVGN